MTNTDRLAYATLLSTASYVPGVLALHRSLRRHGRTRHPLVCVCSKSVDEDAVETLRRESIQCLTLAQEATGGKITPLNNNAGYGHWNHTFDKLLLWQLTQFDKLVYLDSDMLVLGPLDELFEHPDFSAVAAGQKANATWTRLNSGLMVIEPNETTCRRLLAQIGDTVERFTREGRSVGDQDVLNDAMPTWPDLADLHLDEGYNLFAKNLTLYHRQHGYDYGRNIRVVHFIGARKPWHDSPLKRWLRLAKLLAKNPYAVRAYWEYCSLL